MSGVSRNRVLRNYVSGNGYDQQLVSAGVTDFGIGVLNGNDNVIEGNVVTGNSNGIFVTSNARGNIVRGNIATANPALQQSTTFTATTCATPPCRGGDLRISAPEGANTIVDNHCITVVTNASFTTPPCRIFLPTSDLTLTTGLSFDSSRVPVGGSFNATFSGSNLTSETYFDIRVRAPGTNVDQEVPNWQKGPTTRHTIAEGTAAGDWRITGVRAHQDTNEHSGPFAPIEAIVSVFVSPFGF
jgi:parallel beta-helix repeat protein